VDALTIAGCRAKVARAEASIEEMAGEWREWINGDAYAPRIDEHGGPGEYRLYFDFSRPVDPRFGVRIGEIAHDLRSALDHLVWCEATEFLGREPTEDEARKYHIAFPVTHTRVLFKKSQIKRYVSKDAWTVIERHQPYVRGKQKRSRALALLQWVNRIDKHRILHWGTVSVGFFNPLWLIDFDPTARLLTATVEVPLGRPLKHETQVACYVFATDGPEPKMRMERAPPLNVAFGDTPHYLPRVELGETVRDVRRVINDFASLVP
jgi:hypothetical protein